MNKKIAFSMIFISIFALVFGLTRETLALSGSGKVKVLVSYKDDTKIKLFDSVKKITMYHENNKIVLIELRDKDKQRNLDQLLQYSLF